MKGTWNRNLEHEGLQVEFPGKPEQEIINKLKGNGFRWSRRQGIWYAKEQPWRVTLLNEIAEYGGEVGEKLSFAEKMDRKVERAEYRAERFGTKAEKAEQTAEDLATRARDMASIIPLGQPILVGHYSEGRDRRYRAKIDNTFRKAFETSGKADYYAQRAKAASEFRSRTFNPGTVQRKIKDLEASVRKADRYSDQHIARWTLKYNQLSRKSLEWYENEIAPLQEQIDYWKKTLEDSGVKVWGPDDFESGNVVKTRHGPAKVLKVNKKTLRVEYINSRIDWINKSDLVKVPYDELPQNCKEDDSNEQEILQTSDSDRGAVGGCTS